MQIQLDFWYSFGYSLSQFGKKLFKIPRGIGSLGDLMDGPDSLSLGLLSQAIIPPAKLENLLYHVKRKLIEYFKYELTMTIIHQCYD